MTKEEFESMIENIHIERERETDALVEFLTNTIHVEETPNK